MFLVMYEPHSIFVTCLMSIGYKKNLKKCSSYTVYLQCKVYQNQSDMEKIQLPFMPNEDGLFSKGCGEEVRSSISRWIELDAAGCNLDPPGEQNTVIVRLPEAGATQKNGKTLSVRKGSFTDNLQEQIIAVTQS